MEQPKKYYAFISYKREDEKWARWLQNKLEHYRFPVSLNGRVGLPKTIRPTFRDVTDLKPGLLESGIDTALRDSQWLIILCSPRSAKSPWVCKEAQTFIDLGLADHIIPFIIEGIPFSDNASTECYPEALLKLTGRRELLGVNINERGRYFAVVKVVARMFNLDVNALWQPYKREQKRIRTVRYGLAMLFVLLASALLFSGIRYYDKKVVEYCMSGIKADDGLYNIQRNLFDYQRQDWLLKKETRSILKRRIYELDFSYHAIPFPVIYSYQSKGGVVDQVKFRYDEAGILIGTGVGETSGILDYSRNSFKSFGNFASTVGFVHNSDTIITCGAEVHLYDENAKMIAEYNVDGYGMVESPTHNCFTCKNMDELTTYNIQNGGVIAKQKFGKDILCYAYNNTGEYIAVATIDSLLSLICAETGDIISQRRDSLPIAAITPTNDVFSFYAAFFGDSTRVTKVRVDSKEQDTLLFSIPTHRFRRNKLSYNFGEYLAFTNGRFFMLHNIRTKESIPWDVYNELRAEMEAIDVSISGTKFCYSVNGRIYVRQIKTKKQQHRFPIQQYGFLHDIGLSTANICHDDSTVVMAVIKNKELTTVDLYNLYTGKHVGKTFETTEPVGKVLPLPTPYHVAVALSETNGWAVIDFSTSDVVKKLAVDTLTCLSSIMLTANRKYLIGMYEGPYIFGGHDYRCVWSPTTYHRIDSAYFYSGPLQDGEHMYIDYMLYTYPERKKLFQLKYNAYSENGEFFDGNEMAFLEGFFLSIFNMRNGDKHSINLNPYVQGDATNYQLGGYKNNFALLFNDQHLMVFDTNNDEMVLEEKTNPMFERITSALFFNNGPRVLVSTNMALYVYDLLDFEQLMGVWKERYEELSKSK